MGKGHEEFFLFYPMTTQSKSFFSLKYELHFNKENLNHAKTIDFFPLSIIRAHQSINQRIHEKCIGPIFQMVGSNKNLYDTDDDDDVKFHISYFFSLRKKNEERKRTIYVCFN